jgi:hypothetical protein
MHDSHRCAAQVPPAANKPEVPFGSNEVRLSPRQWVVALLLLAALIYYLPILWRRIEPLEITPDYRTAFRLGNDYWAYQRYCGEVCRLGKTLVLGDSVLWGHYVASGQTLSHYLNQQTGSERFANVGVDGIHPAAMAGLVEYYGRDIAGRKVVLGCNLLWMSSKRHDLQSEKEFAFNHPALVPQFVPRIPCYRAPLSAKLGIVVGRMVPLVGWADHLRIVLLDNDDLPHWAMEHPYDCPTLTSEIASPDEPPSPVPVAKPWTEQGITKFNPAWVELDTSLQWRWFRQTVELLRRRGNRVFVLLGPFNEHMLTEESLKTYRQRQRDVETWLRAEGIAYYVPPALPSRYYADASHPLAEGYAQLAQELCGQESFCRFNAEP